MTLSSSNADPSQSETSAGGITRTVQGREERSVPENLERPDGDMVEMSSHSQTLIERSSTSQLRSFTSTIEASGSSRRRLEINLQNHAVTFLQRRYHQTMTTNDESFLLTLCRHKTLGTPPGSVRRGSSTEFATESQSSISLQPHYARGVADATAPTRSVLQLRMC